MLSTNTISNNNRVFSGDTNIILNYLDKTHSWANNLYRKSLENFWIPEKFSLEVDILCWSMLPLQEKEIFKALIGYAIALDSLQSKNMSNLCLPIVNPLISSLLVIQQSFETIHSLSYSYLSESLLSSEEKEKIYQYWLLNPLLRQRCLQTATTYQNYQDNNNDWAAYAQSLLANYILEAIQFQFTFRFFEILERQNKLLATASIISLIKRDEDLHVASFQKLLQLFRQEHPNILSDDMIQEQIHAVIEFEKLFCSDLCQDHIYGLSSQIIDQYFDYLEQDRLQAIGIDTNQPRLTNPLKHLQYSSDYTGSTAKTNFFESQVTSYSQATALVGWDKL